MSRTELGLFLKPKLDFEPSLINVHVKDKAPAIARAPLAQALFPGKAAEEPVDRREKGVRKTATLEMTECQISWLRTPFRH